MVELLYACSPESICNHYFRESFFYAWTYFSSASVWCATWLSVFYCVKVTNFAQRLFLWLKSRIDKLVPRLLGLSLTVFSLPFAASGIKMKSYCSPTGNMTGNAHQGEQSNNYRFWIFISLHFSFVAINVSICLTATILLLISLWRHTRNLKRSGIATKDFNTQAHINVVNSLLSFLFFYILYVVVVTISLSYKLRLGTVDSLVANVVVALCPSVHSIILILTNPKLKDVCVRIVKIRRRTS
ncbi:taste receptor type 2 member 105-like [Tiliqua scincoides]|uniref:taste receptor type 2 member 105-like n=1 Tax=Tiliqua scincoides TaxID=71010 RepID=UPI0034629A26